MRGTLKIMTCQRYFSLFMKQSTAKMTQHLYFMLCRETRRKIWSERN